MQSSIYMGNLSILELLQFSIEYIILNPHLFHFELVYWTMKYSISEL